jgi:MarR family transcriptional regulator, organic hydroperoxide resistance regulator
MTTTVRVDPAAEAWKAILDLTLSQPRFPRVADELGMSPKQLHVLHRLAPGVELPTGALAETMYCDASNVTGIVDRLEERGLIERRPDPGDRRVKRLAITDQGAKLRERALCLLLEPPTEIAALSRSDQRTLRDLLRKASALSTRD